MTTATAAPALTAQDRCDQCGAQAYVRVSLKSGDLYFCAHHGRKQRAALEPIAVRILDESERLSD